MPKDDQIISLLVQHKTQEKGLRMLMEMYQERLYWHIRRLVVDHDIAKDVLQEVFIKVFQNIKQFKNESKLFTWLYRIATNEALQEIRKQKKLQDTETDENALMRLVAEQSLPDAEEIQILLQKAIQTLPEKQKLVFVMRYYDDLSYEEISKLLESSVGTLKTNYHFAKEKIENYIKKSIL